MNMSEKEIERRKAIDKFMAYIESLPPMAIVD